MIELPPPDLLDVHSHYVTDAYIAAATAAGVAPDGMPAWPSWTAEEHLALMDAQGIRTAILSVSSPGVHFGDDAAARALAVEVNDVAAAARAAHPGRFGHFAALPLPDVPGAVAELGRALDELGSDGVIVESNAHGVYPGDERNEPLWAEADRRGVAVFVHPTSPPGHEAVSLGMPRPMMEFLFDSARAAVSLVLAGTLTRYPNIRWIFTHGGGVLPLVAARVDMFRMAFSPGGPPPGPTASEQLCGIFYDLAGNPFPHQMPALVGAFGEDRVVYGSDYCFTPPFAVAAQLSTIDDQTRALTSTNVARLFPGHVSDPSRPGV